MRFGHIRARFDTHTKTKESERDMTIKRRDFIKKAGTGAAGVAALGACSSGEGSADAVQAGGVSGPRVEWRLATSFPPSLDILHGAGVRVAERVAALTNNNFTIRVYAAGEIVPALQVMDAVMQGTVQCGVSPGYYYIGKNPALAFDTAIPFGLSTRQQYAWMMHGGGLDLLAWLRDPALAPSAETDARDILAVIRDDPARQLAPEMAARLDVAALISVGSIEAAIDAMKTDTAPGADGFPPRFYKDRRWRRRLAERLHRLYAQIVRDGEMTEAMRESVISILYKGKGKCIATRIISDTAESIATQLREK